MGVYGKCALKLPAIGVDPHESYYSGAEALSIGIREDVEDAVRYLLEKFDVFSGVRFFYQGHSKWGAFM